MGWSASYQGIQVRIPRELVTAHTPNILRECVTQYFLFLSSQTPVWWAMYCTLSTSPFHEHLWGDPGIKGKNIQRAMYPYTHSSFSFLSHEHLFDGLCNTYQVHQVRTPTGLATHSTILNILRECVKHSFLYPPSSTPVGWSASYQGIQVRIPRELATAHTPNILRECVTQYFLFPPSQTPVRWAM